MESKQVVVGDSSSTVELADTLVISSKKGNKHKLLLVAAALLSIVLIILIIVSINQWNTYKAGQDFVINSTLNSGIDSFNAYLSDREQLVFEIRFFLQVYANDADEVLAKMLRQSGFSCGRYGSEYLSYASYGSYLSNQSYFPGILICVLGIIVAIIIFVRMSRDKSQIQIDGEKILLTSTYGNQVEIQKSSITSFRPIVLEGLEIKGKDADEKPVEWKIYDVANLSEIKAAISSASSAKEDIQRTEPINDLGPSTETLESQKPLNSTDSFIVIGEYKKMLDNGLITQDEFELKKKQLFDL